MSTDKAWPPVEEALKQIKQEVKLNLYEKMSELQKVDIEINKDKAAHGYSYATLDQIMDKLRPLLIKHKLLLYHQTCHDKDEKKQYLETIILDIENPSATIRSVTYLDDTITLPGQNKVMVIGSMITYFRRYHVTSMFGLTTETDNDAGGAKKAGKSDGRSVEAAGVERKTDFELIFKNMVAKNKPKETIQKQFDAYKSQMSDEQIAAIITLISKIE